MANRRSGDSPQTGERSKRQERAQRILDAAEALTLRWGYSKTTIDDIAKQAGVAKGTIYLHWKTREELFHALITRAQLKLVEDIEQRIANDPEGATLHGLIKNTTLATMKNPLWKAVLLRDTAILGEFARTEYGKALNVEREKSFKSYLTSLRNQGLVRTDMSIEEQIYLVSSLSMGFLLVEPFLPDQYKLSDEAAAGLLAETIRCTLERGGSTSADELQGVSATFNQYFHRVLDIVKEQNQEELES